MVVKLNGIEINGEIADTSIIGDGMVRHGKMLLIHDDTTAKVGDSVQDRDGNEWWIVHTTGTETEKRNIHLLDPKTD
ncbi:hypothetical protein DI396_04045 [Litorivita pollutaquae]|uniref:Uncharacterized protein n=1 Tax=Litorivita pollutaquae TaxID=2200892 RepID=A0A2V4MV75_9RHOB|nr:hypothetical protein [Litorivita pollutaquae]PYC48188.1 hypothetical protein DI396_04045 [Litorivita pollutaquae]